MRTNYEDFTHQKPNLDSPMDGKQYAANFFSYLDFCRTLAESEEMKQYVTLSFDELVTYKVEEKQSHYEEDKPLDSYALMIYKALESSNEGKLTLAEIYTWIESNYSYYQKADLVWRNSIRHNLSLNPAFKKIPRPLNAKGKGGYWAIDPNYRSGKTIKTKKIKKSFSSGSITAQAPSDIFNLTSGKMVF